MPQLAPTAIEPTELKGLIESTSPPAVSLYLPTIRATAQPEENSLHLKSALPRVEKQLQDRGLRRPQASELIEPLRALLTDRDFWQHQRDGLALLRTPDAFETFRLPFSVQERAVVADSPYVTPLFRSLGYGTRFYVLGISQNALRIVSCYGEKAEEIDVSQFDVPQSLAEALRYDDLERPESMHHPTTGPGAVKPGGQRQRETRGGRSFHGHGEDGDDHKDQIKRFIQLVDARLAPHFNGAGAPLVLAGVDYVRSIYLDVTGARNVLEGGIDGNPDQLRPGELLARALPIMRARWDEQMAALRNRYEVALAHGGADCELEPVLWAAHDGRVDTLFVRDGVEDWARIDPAGRTIERSGDRGPGVEELHDLAVRRAVLSGSDVLVLDEEAMPCEGPIAAVYRY